MITDSPIESTASVDVAELQSLKNRVVEIRQQIAELQTELTAKDAPTEGLGPPLHSGDRAFDQWSGHESCALLPPGKRKGARAKRNESRRQNSKFGYREMPKSPFMSRHTL